jgi:hypothetical protein
VEKLIQVASVVYELERRGKDLSSLKIGLIPYLRKIAKGELLPELVVKYSGEPRSLQKVAKLPVTVQQEIFDGKRDFIPAAKVRGNPGTAKGICARPTKEEEGLSNFGGLPGGSQESLTRMKGRVSNGGARDVAEMIWEMVSEHPESSMVLQHLLTLALNASVIEPTLAKQIINNLPKQVSNTHRRRDVSAY